MSENLRDQIVPQLLAYEPNYTKLAAEGEQLLPILSALIREDDARLAERAVVLAFRLGSPDAQEITAHAASDPRSQVRSAVATNAHLLPGAQAAKVLEKLLVDSDPSIRRLSLNTAAKGNILSLIEIIDTLSESDEEAVVRETAKHALKKLRNK